jgi:hypothetical protein
VEYVHRLYPKDGTTGDKIDDFMVVLKWYGYEGLAAEPLINFNTEKGPYSILCAKTKGYRKRCFKLLMKDREVDYDEVFGEVAGSSYDYFDYILRYLKETEGTPVRIWHRNYKKKVQKYIEIKTKKMKEHLDYLIII